MCNCMNRGCSGCAGQGWVHCGTPCFSLGPFRAGSTVCPPINTGSIIPFSSGITGVAFTTDGTGAVATVSTLGFGSAVSDIVPAADGTITLPVGTTTEAFNVPRIGTISAISATFTETTGITLPVGAVVTITARIYRAPAGSSVFSPTNAFVNLTPTVTGTAGAVYQGTASANVPVLPGDRLVMVYSAAGTGITTTPAPLTFTGSGTAGITIS